MPVPNDLTPEEEAEFAQHGVQPAGQGQEPLAEQGQQQPPAGGETTPPPEQQQQGQPRDEQGRFAPRQQQQEGEQGQQQGQQQEGEQGQQQEPKMVPLEALHAERQRVREMAQRMQTLQNRTNMILQNRQPEQQQRQMPDINEDPAGYIVAINERLEQFEQNWRQTQETQQLDTNLTNDENLFTMTQSDYPQASDYYVQSRARELMQFYPPEQAQQMMLNEARQIARQAWQQGRSAGEAIYNLALARGYSPNASNANAQPQPQQQNGQQQHQPNAAEIVNGVRQAQGQSRSLSGAAGGSRTAALNAQALLDMSDEEFEATLGLGTKGANARFANVG